MIITRLIRLFTILKLTRRAAYFTLRDVRDEFGCGNRARGLRLLRTYRGLKADLNRIARDIRARLTALTAVTSAEPAR
jgi:hypothetical protein